MDFMNDSEDYSKDLETIMHRTIKKVSNDFETLKFNTAIAQLMAFTNAVYQKSSITRKEMKHFLILLNPVAPHITEEMWSLCGFEGYLHNQQWPSYDEDKTIEDQVEIVIQVNGKIRAKMMIASDMSKQDMEELVHTDDTIIQALEGKKPRKIIAVPKSLINIVV